MKNALGPFYNDHSSSSCLGQERLRSLLLWAASTPEKSLWVTYPGTGQSGSLVFLGLPHQLWSIYRRTELGSRIRYSQAAMTVVEPPFWCVGVGGGRELLTSAVLRKSACSIQSLRGWEMLMASISWWENITFDFELRGDKVQFSCLYCPRAELNFSWTGSRKGRNRSLVKCQKLMVFLPCFRLSWIHYSFTIKS